MKPLRRPELCVILQPLAATVITANLFPSQASNSDWGFFLDITFLASKLYYLLSFHHF